MFDGGGALGFSQQTRSCETREPGGGYVLERVDAPQGDVSNLVDDAEATPPQLSYDAVAVTDDRSRREGSPVLTAVGRPEIGVQGREVGDIGGLADLVLADLTASHGTVYAETGWTLRSKPPRLLSALRRYARHVDSEDLREANARLREENLRLRMQQRRHEFLFANAIDMIHIVDPSFRIIEVNDTELHTLGYKREELLGAPLQQLIHPDYREVTAARMAVVREGEPVAKYETVFVTKDGRQLQVLANVIPIMEDGELVCAQAVVHDVTQLRTAEKALIHSERMASVGTLAAGVAHEINNPLAYVISNIDVAAEELRDIGGGSPSARFRELLATVVEAREGAERIRRIVRGLRTFSRSDEEVVAPVDLRRVLDGAVNMAGNEIRHRAQLVKEYGAAPAVMADESRLVQVFVNLLVNAAHAIDPGMAERNEIRVVTGPAGEGRAFVEVRDTGSGISEELEQRIFEPFFTTKPAGVGTGLGLSICHGIVTRAGGSIAFDSELGVGSRVRVELPTAAHVETRLEPRVEQPKREGPRGRVLVVDDDLMLGRSIHRVLSREHDVVVVDGGRAALQELERIESPYDLILCDLMMPDMTGMELHRRLSQTRPELISRMVFISGGAFSSDASDFLSRVPNQRLEKPFDLHALRALVRVLVGNAKS